jgi:signal peptidase I
MERNPYQAPVARVDAAPEAPVRRGWVAGVLAVVTGPPVAMLYVGRWRRALVYLLAFVLLLAIAIAVTGAGVPFSAAIAVSSLAYVVIGATEAVRLAKSPWLPARMPWYSRGWAFATIAVATLILRVGVRLFVVQPYQIPSGAMIPNLLVGDVILVNKSAYGLRFMGSPLVRGEPPGHGDVVVFKYPENPQLDYVKRVIGRPGDDVEYRGKRLYVNGRELPRTDAVETMIDVQAMHQFRETHGQHAYPILHHPDQPAYQPAGVRDFPHRTRCNYSEDGFRCSVPEGHYFAMGDNRDSSSDSRYWGFVPDDYLVGRVLVVLCSRGRPRRLFAEVP